MKTQIQAALMLLIAVPGIGFAQTPVDEDGVVLGAYEPAYGVKPEIEPLGNEDIPLLSGGELEELVGPIALYPDDLLAIVLPASAYPLQIVEAGRFLEALEEDSSLKPDPEWDDAVVALLNYPEVVELLNDDIDWTWRLGEAVVAQQGDVVTAIESFRDRAYAAGNLKSDEYQQVTRNEGAIEITPVSDDVIYVPYYEPERVVVYQPRRVYYYYPRAYPVYYYPYSSAYHFDRGYFWGVTTAFTIGWLSDSLHVYHHSYHGHPYYGHHYWDRWWYRRPSIHIYNTTYVRRPNVTINRYYRGDRWEPRHDRRDYHPDGRDRVTRNRHSPPRRDDRESRSRPARREEPIRFRERPERQQPAVARRDNRDTRVVQRDARRDQATREQRRQPERQTRQQQDRREPAAREQRRQPERQARSDRFEPDVWNQRRQPERQVRQQQRQPERQARQERRQPERQARQERRQPERQARPERRQPERQVRPQRREAESRAPERRSEPQRQARSERQESRSAGGRGSSGERSGRRSKR